MSTLTNMLQRAALVLPVLALSVVFPQSAAAQVCSTCGPMSVAPTQVGGLLTTTSNSNATPASTGYGKFTVAISQSGTTPLPTNLPAGNYPAWCGTRLADGVQSQPYIATSAPPANVSPATLIDPIVMSEINYVLNHKQGMISDVQAAIWTLLGTTAVLDLQDFGLTTAIAIVNDAIANGQHFTPAAGQREALLLLSTSNTANTQYQHLLVELIHCGSLGDRVWSDSNANGLQDSGEPGINGVTVQLQDSNGNALASVMTMPSPVNYPYLPANTDGWYQFTGLCPGSTYKVNIPTGQSALTGTTPTSTLTGIDRGIDSNLNPTTVTLPNTSPAIDPTIDFGYTGAAPLVGNCPSPAAIIGSQYSGQISVTGGLTPYTFTLTGALPSGVTMSSTGLISGNIPTSAMPASFPYSVAVKDASGTTLTPSLSCSVVLVKPMGLICPTTTGQAGSYYSSALIASGGSGQYTFAITGGSLPPGLTLNTTTGAITGTPTTGGTFNFTASVSDPTGVATTVATNCGISISSSALMLQCPNGTAKKGTAYSSFLIATGGTNTYTKYEITAGALPPGLSLNPATGQITGVPTDEGSWSFTATVTDSSGAQASTSTSSQCTITVGPAFTVLCASGTAYIGYPYSSNFSIQGGAGNFTYVVTGTLPANLIPSGMGISGTVANTAAAQTYSYTVQATQTGAIPVTQSAACQIQVYTPPSLLCSPVKAGSLGTLYDSFLVASGGTHSYVYTLATGSSLPSGWSLNQSTGEVKGTMPSQPGTIQFTAQVTDSSGATAITIPGPACQVQAVQPLQAVCAGAAAQVGVLYTSNVSGSGGLPAYTYSLASGSLPAWMSGPDPVTGLMSGTPDSATTVSYTLKVTDSSGNTAVSTATQACTIMVAPAAPTVTCPPSTGQATIAYVGGLSASGGVSPYTYSISSGTLPGGLTLNSSTGAITGSPAAAGTFTFTGKVVDSRNSAAGTGTSSCSIVTSAPPLKISCASAFGEVGVPYSSGLAVSGGTGPYTYAVASGSLPSGLHLDANTGTISGTPDTAASYSYTVQVTDSLGNTATTAGCTIAIVAKLTATCAATSGEVGVPYSSQIAVSGGVAPYTFSLFSGSLPSGLSLNGSTGTISGTPNVSGLFTPVVKVVDASGLATYNTVTTGGCGINIIPALSLACANPIGVVGVAYSSKLVASGGVAPYTYSITGSLPNGLTLDPSTGTISGIPLTSGPFSFTAQVVDASGTSKNTAVSNCGITIAPSISLSCAASTGTVGYPYSSALVASGGTLPYQFSISAGALPAGLTLNATTGAITGIPTTATTYSFTASVLDSSGNTFNAVSTACGIVVSPTANICGLTWGYWKNHTIKWPVTTFHIGAQDYTQAELLIILGLPVSGDASLNLAHQLIAAKLNVVNGTNQLTDQGAIVNADVMLSTFAGKLPYNVSSSSASWTPMVNLASQLDTFNSDGAGQQGCVNGPATLKIVCASGTGQVGVTYTSAVTASGGFGPYTYSIVSGSLPAGLTLDPNSGVISGVPQSAGTFNFSVMAADTSSILPGSTVGTVTSNCTIVVTGLPTATCVTINAVQGVAIIPVTMTATGGTGAGYTFSATGLPAGLTMASNGTISGTPTVSGTFGYTVTIKDGAGNTGTINCSVTVAPVVSATCVTINAVQGIAITPVTMTATGGTGAGYTFSATGLPAGLTMASNGTISGTPTVSGTFGYTVTIKDGAGNTGTINCSVTVLPTPTLLCPTISGQVGSLYSSALVATGGSGKFTFAAGSLPPGLSMTSAGIITGTPTTAGSFSFTATATDTVTGKTISTNCTITIANGNACGLTWGFWKNHVSIWPVTSMVLGSQTYSLTELQSILGQSVAGDQSLELAHQLIAAKFNVLNGTNLATANGAITTADSQLAGFTGKLPYKIASSTTIGAQMVATASALNTFNSDGKAQPGCSMLTGGCGGSIGNFVWIDANFNGIQDLGEIGLAGVTVRLRDANNNLLQTTTTNANGQYEFTGLCAGTYVIEVVTPANYMPTIVGAAAAGGDKDSNATPTTVVLTTSNSTNMDTDFGFYKTSCSGSIGSFVWKDLNGNGIQDIGEPGLPGVMLSLSLSPYGVIQTAMTDAAGNYQFGGLCGGTYTVSVTTPPGYTPTGSLLGKDSTKDSNVSGGSVTLSTSTSSDTTMDFGFKVVASNATGFTTFTQGGWGAAPKGNNPGSMLLANFANIYPTGVATGGATTLRLTFSSAVAVQGFLPQGGTPATLALSASNPTTSAAGVLAGQTLALQLSVDFSNAGVNKKGLGALKVVSGKLAGYTVTQVLSLANTVLGGVTTGLPTGVSISDLNGVIDSINNNYDGGTVNKGYLQ
jgi:hypothetical protein